jgi:hypothetical protein
MLHDIESLPSKKSYSCLQNRLPLEGAIFWGRFSPCFRDRDLEMLCRTESSAVP